MKKTILLFSAIVLFAGLTFGQTPQTQDKATTTTTKAQTTTAAPAKDAKAGCDKKDMEKCSKSKDAKSGCCAHGEKKAATDTKAPEKK
jgi:hypothetical protein